MSLKEPNYNDENGRLVHETWVEGKLVSTEISDLGDLNDKGYYEQIQYDDLGRKSSRKVREPTPNGFNRLEEKYDKGFLTSQTEEIAGHQSIVKFRHYYPQTMPDGTKMDTEILRREEIINQTTGQTTVKEFSLTGEEMVPEKKKIVPFTNLWKSKDR